MGEPGTTAAMSTELDTRTEPTEAPPSTVAPEVARLPELEIKPPGRFSGVGLREIWAYRELLYFLTKRAAPTAQSADDPSSTEIAVSKPPGR